MKAYQPKNLRELEQVLRDSAENAEILSGGTDFIIAERRSGRQPEELIYVGGVAEMKEWKAAENGMFIGACCTMSQIEKSPILAGSFAAVAEAAAGVGSAQIRNRGTIGGNIAHASPAADLAAPLMCFDSEAVVLRGGELVRIPVERLITGSEKTLLQKKDVILGFWLPVCPEDTVSHYYKLGSRRQVSISRFGVAIALRLEEETAVQARIAIGSIGEKALRMRGMERALTGRKPDRESGQLLGRMLEEHIRGTSGRRYKAWASAGVMEDALAAFR